MDIVARADPAAMNVDILGAGNVTAVTKIFELRVKEMARTPSFRRFCQASEPIRAMIPAHFAFPLFASSFLFHTSLKGLS